MNATEYQRECAALIVDELLDDLDGRSGFDTGGLDDEVRDTWRKEWIAMVSVRIPEPRR